MVSFSILKAKLMKKITCIIILLCLASNLLSSDLIVTKNNKKYRGHFLRRTERGLLLKTDSGTLIVLPIEQISKIYRSDKSIWDFETRTRYYLKKNHPFLPFIFLGLATGAYAVQKYQDYQKHKQQAESEEQMANADYLADQSKRDLAWCIVSSLFSAGSIYVAFIPMEVKVPIGRINLSATSNGINIALHF